MEDNLSPRDRAALRAFNRTINDKMEEITMALESTGLTVVGYGRDVLMVSNEKEEQAKVIFARGETSLDSFEYSGDGTLLYLDIKFDISSDHRDFMEQVGAITTAVTRSGGLVH